MIELIKGCKRCKSLPKFSTFGGMASGLKSCAFVCCSSISGKTQEEAAWRWNIFNVDCTTIYQYNRETQQWELYSALETE